MRPIEEIIADWKRDIERRDSDDMLADERLIAELERLQAIVAKLPVTADGVPLHPGMTVYRYHKAYGGMIEPTVTIFGRWDCETKPHYVECRTDGNFITNACKCYSTRAAAEAAKEK